MCEVLADSGSLGRGHLILNEETVNYDLLEFDVTLGAEEVQEDLISLVEAWVLAMLIKE